MLEVMLGTAAVLTVVVGVAHSWLGEVKLLIPLFSKPMQNGILASHFACKVLRYAWHMTSVTWWGFAAIFVVLAMSPLEDQGRTILAILGITFLFLGRVTLFADRGRHLAWIVFFAIAGLSLVPLLQSHTLLGM